jgi:hypothetical protein
MLPFGDRRWSSTHSKTRRSMEMIRIRLLRLTASGNNLIGFIYLWLVTTSLGQTIASSVVMISEQWVAIDVEGKIRGLIWHTVPSFSCSDWGKLLKPSEGKTKIWARNFQNANQEWYPLNRDVCSLCRMLVSSLSHSGCGDGEVSCGLQHIKRCFYKTFQILIRFVYHDTCHLLCPMSWFDKSEEVLPEFHVK